MDLPERQGFATCREDRSGTKVIGRERVRWNAEDLRSNEPSLDRPSLDSKDGEVPHVPASPQPVWLWGRGIGGNEGGQEIQTKMAGTVGDSCWSSMMYAVNDAIAVAMPIGGSYARVEEAVVVHATIDVDASPDSTHIIGFVEYDVAVQADGVQAVLLDMRGIEIHAAGPKDEATGDWMTDAFAEGESEGAIGAPLAIGLGETAKKKGDVVSLRVDFETEHGEDKYGRALQSLTKEQTSGKEHCLSFTQCQAIHARSLFPCQDTPAVKFTYEAVLEVPPSMRVLMAACEVPCTEDEIQFRKDGGNPRYDFVQKVPVPAYLFAFAVGNFESREIGPRTRVWAEPNMVDAAALEFADTNKFLEAAESLAGPYRWGRYDLLLLPPSFPYGGMENPCLTFVTPTLIAGDGSLAHVIAHEIAHSWTGNLVTNKGWEHFWLNEGWTVFLERKILGRVYGEEILQLHAIAGHEELCEEVRRIGPTHKFTALIPKLKGFDDPDDAFSKIPYEKGFHFLYFLQELVGGPAQFEPFMRDYIQHFALSTVDSYQFKAYFVQYFKSNPKISSVEWEKWFHSPGMPVHENHYDHSLAEAARALATDWHSVDPLGIGNDEFHPSFSDIEGWSVHQLIVFLDRLIALRALKPLHSSMVEKLGEAYKFFESGNSEIKGRFLRLGVLAGNARCYDGAVSMLNEQGRMKFLRPLYRALNQGDSQARQLAKSTFQENKSRYHPIAAKMVGADLGLE